jgi:3D-(3,5/4)-trihydroxycyclohexane-1,2-dione acylhydrolase (decyclizing)
MLSDEAARDPGPAGRHARAAAIVAAGGIDAALEQALLPPRVDVTLAEAIVLGLVRMGVRRFVGVLGHGSTEIGEVLRVYEDAGALRCFGVRHETEAAHAATALRWMTGERAAVVTSIGPGALAAMAGSLASASDGIGVWHVYGDETTEAEGPNLQQIPEHDQERYLRLCATMGHAYTLHTPEALPTALRRGAQVVEHPHRAGPYYLLAPLNTQPQVLRGLHLAELPTAGPPPLGPAADHDNAYDRAAQLLAEAERVLVKVGGGARAAGAEVVELLELADGVAVTSPLASGVVPYGHPRNLTVGGSKGSSCANAAMEEADVLVVVGSRAVCQSDCSRTGYPRVCHVININTDPTAALHYARTLAFVGDAAPTLAELNRRLRARVAATPAATADDAGHRSAWATRCAEAKADWDAYKAERYAHPTLHDDVWDAEVLTQPAAIRTITTVARQRDGAVCVFDAGDVQANGFQVVEDDRPGRTITETGASYMGFAASAVLASALTDQPVYPVAITGDGSFTMSPQVLIDGVAHGARGCVVVLDNRRMGAISSLQREQYGVDHATADGVAVDYVAWAHAVEGVRALDGGRTVAELEQALHTAFAYDGLSLVHVPVYWGDDPLGGLGAWGRWNVGSWVAETQALRHEIGL